MNRSSMDHTPRQSGTTRRPPVVLDASPPAPPLAASVAERGESLCSETARPGAIPVILVGRTNLEGALRLDSTFEVHRAADGPAAIGQVSHLPPGTGACPLVVIAPDSDPATRQPEFTAAVALVAPSARVVRLRSADDPSGGAAASGADVFELLIQPGQPGVRETLRRLARHDPAADSNALAEAVVESVMPHRSAPPSAAPAPADAVPAEPIDTPMLQAMLAGRDVLLAAMDVIRRALGAAKVHFEEAACPADAGERLPGMVAQSGAPASPVLSGATGAEPPHRIRVSHHAKVYGDLVSSRAAAPALAPWADWLAHWLALRDQQEQLRTAALVDDLTGAWNRRYFEGFLAAALKHAAEHGHSVTVLYFDIDDFKRYNDTYGHGAGDDILRETVRLLQSVIRPTDRVCRIGGDEFGVIFHEPEGPRDPASHPPSSIWEIARRFQRQICEHRFPKLGELAPGTLTISGGLASYPHDATTAEDLVKRADELAIRSKRQGKNAITLGPGAERVCGVT